MFAEKHQKQQENGVEKLSATTALNGHSNSNGGVFDLSNLDPTKNGINGTMPTKATHLKEEKVKELAKVGNGEADENGLKEEGRVKYLGFATTAIRTGIQPERWDMCQVVPPISLSTTYRQPTPGLPMGHEYSRNGNPTRDVLEDTIAAMEEGEHCRVYSSGMGATAALASLVTPGGHIILLDDGYGGTLKYFRQICQAKQGIRLSFVDLTRIEELKKALVPETKMVWLESPSNPLLKVVDIQEVVKVAKAYNPDIFIVVDNTFMTPVFQRPLQLGADAVLHSLTKYMNGHSDVVMGAVVTNSKELDEHLLFQQSVSGAVPSAFDCFLVVRGIKTLHLRMKQHMENALIVAKWLEADPRIEKVYYPELESHPQHKVHKKQATGMSGMIAVYLRGGLEVSQKFLTSLKIFLLATSLGGFESLASLPSQMSHQSVPQEIRTHLGITDSLIRISVGCEDKLDLLNDLDQALEAATGRTHG